MKKVISVFLLFISTFTLVSANSASIVDSLYHDIEIAESAGDAERAYMGYRALRDAYDSINIDINRNQVEDLRRTYFVDDLSLQEAKHRVTMLRVVLAAVILLSFISTLGYFMVRRQKARLIASQKYLGEMQQQVAYSLRNKSLYLSNMSHEIRTPLNALTGFSSILSESSADPALAKQCRELIKFNADLLLNLINEVVDITCLDVENISFNLQRIEVVNLCRQVVNTLDGIKRTQAVISFKSDIDELYIYTDQVRLQQVLINIVINATKYTPEGSIVLELKTDHEGMALFSITDTGCGIPKEEQKKIFERYRTLDENVKGTGIGLSLCSVIISRLGGDIWVDENYTSGSRFVFTHPMKGGAA